MEMDAKVSFIGGWLFTTASTISVMGFFQAAFLGLVGGFFGLLRGGPINPNDVITRFYESNKARFNVQKEMWKNMKPKR